MMIFSVMESFIRCWKKDGYIAKIRKVKRVFFEKRKVDEFNAVFAQYTSFMNNYCSSIM